MPPPRPPLPSHDDPPYPTACQDSDDWCSPPQVLPPPPTSPASHGSSTFLTALIIVSSVLVFLAVCLSVFLFVRRRRQQRRRREALLEAALTPAVPAAFPDGDGGGPEPGEEVVHHAWHIRTLGLDEAAIESIALTRYRAGAAAGASDCAVCLGDFRDGELLRLLPKCAHAFHVPCIDTWLRAHVNCPLCRAHALDPAAVEQLDPPAGAEARTDADASSERNIGALEHEQLDQPGNEQRELRLQIDQRHRLSSPEQPHHHPGPRGRNFRRVASMDFPSPIASAEEASEDDEAGGAKQGTGDAVCCEVSPESSGRLKNHRGMKRSLSVGSRWALVSRHCRRSSLLLPL